jgi:hypothetical protein
MRGAFLEDAGNFCDVISLRHLFRWLKAAHRLNSNHQLNLRLADRDNTVDLITAEPGVAPGSGGTTSLTVTPGTTTGNTGAISGG